MKETSNNAIVRIVFAMGVAAVATTLTLQVTGFADLTGQATGWQDSSQGCAVDQELEPVSEDDAEASSDFVGLVRIFEDHQNDPDLQVAANLNVVDEDAYQGTLTYDGLDVKVDYSRSGSEANYTLKLPVSGETMTVLDDGSFWSISLTSKDTELIIEAEDDLPTLLTEADNEKWGMLVMLIDVPAHAAGMVLQEPEGEAYSTDLVKDDGGAKKKGGGPSVGDVISPCIGTEQVCTTFADVCRINTCWLCPSTCQPATCSHDCDCAENDEEIEEYDEEGIDCSEWGMRAKSNASTIDD